MPRLDAVVVLVLSRSGEYCHVNIVTLNVVTFCHVQRPEQHRRRDPELPSLFGREDDRSEAVQPAVDAEAEEEHQLAEGVPRRPPFKYHRDRPQELLQQIRKSYRGDALEVKILIIDLSSYQTYVLCRW